MRLKLILWMVAVTLSGCGGTLGSLHENPSSGADLPFDVGVYVDSQGIDSTLYYKGYVFSDTGSVWVVSDPFDPLQDIADGYPSSRHGTYQVRGDSVEIKILNPHPDLGNKYDWIVGTKYAIPTSRESFYIRYELEYSTGTEVSVRRLLLLRTQQQSREGSEAQ